MRSTLQRVPHHSLAAGLGNCHRYSHVRWLASKPGGPVLPSDLDVFNSENDTRGPKCFVDAYGINSFTINQHKYNGSVFLLPTAALKWHIESIEELTVQHLALSYLILPATRILLLGCGEVGKLIHPDIRKFYREKGIAIEAMDTPNAVATFNILNEEDRAVVAAVVPVHNFRKSPYL